MTISPNLSPDFPQIMEIFKVKNCHSKNHFNGLSTDLLKRKYRTNLFVMLGISAGTLLLLALLAGSIHLAVSWAILGGMVSACIPLIDEMEKIKRELKRRKA